MARSLAAYPARSPRNVAIYIIGFVTFFMVGVRELSGRAEDASFVPTAVLLASVLLLMITDPFLLGRFPWYRYLYFGTQTLVIQALGFLQPYQDIWGALYIFVSVQALYYLPTRAAIIWGGLSAACMIPTLMATTDLLYGLGLGLTYLAGCVLLVSWEILSGQAGRARQESQAVLVELQEAHRQLQAYASQVEAQAAAREHDRLSHELHDSVGQILFGISLTAESARLMLDKDPAAVPEQLEQLQDMTSSALSRMRSLITQWRPEQAGDVTAPVAHDTATGIPRIF